MPSSSSSSSSCSSSYSSGPIGIPPEIPDYIIARPEADAINIGKGGDWPDASKVDVLDEPADLQKTVRTGLGVGRGRTGKNKKYSAPSSSSFSCSSSFSSSSSHMSCSLSYSSLSCSSRSRSCSSRSCSSSSHSHSSSSHSSWSSCSCSSSHSSISCSSCSRSSVSYASIDPGIPPEIPDNIIARPEVAAINIGKGGDWPDASKLDILDETQDLQKTARTGVGVGRGFTGKKKGYSAPSSSSFSCSSSFSSSSSHRSCSMSFSSSSHSSRSRSSSSALSWSSSSSSSFNIWPGDTVVSETSYDQAPSAGSSMFYSRTDHTHGTPINPYSGLTRITVSATAPTVPAPVNGDLWVDIS